MVDCPFCGSPETDRFDLEGRRFLVFACMFTPAVDPSVPEEALAATLAREYGPQGTGYFRRMCDRLHLYVAAGEGAQRLKGASGKAAPPPPS